MMTLEQRRAAQEKIKAQCHSQSIWDENAWWGTEPEKTSVVEDPVEDCAAVEEKNVETEQVEIEQSTTTIDSSVIDGFAADDNSTTDSSAVSQTASSAPQTASAKTTAFHSTSPDDDFKGFNFEKTTEYTLPRYSASQEKKFTFWTVVLILLCLSPLIAATIFLIYKLVAAIEWGGVFIIIIAIAALVASGKWWFWWRDWWHYRN